MDEIKRLRFAVVVAIGVMAVAFIVNHRTGIRVPTMTVEDPRNDRPMGGLTRYYERKTAIGNHEGDRRKITYYWLAPPAPEAGKKYPLVLVLHGSPGNAYAGKYLLDRDLREKHPAFVMAPVISASSTWDFPARMPNFESSEAYYTAAPHLLPHIVDIITQLMQTNPIDPARIYVMGCSEGGFGAFGAARDYPDFFAASVPMSGGWNPEDAPKMTKIPIWAFHGRLDDNVPVVLTKDVATLVHEYGGPIKYTEFPDMHHECPSERLYSAQMWDWLFSQRKAP